MGLERHVRLSDEANIQWLEIRARLSETGESPIVRMIDGELALPNDAVPDQWQELRLGLNGGMVTLCRVGSGVRGVIWGNADAALQRSWNAAVWAVAKACGGMITMEAGEVSADRFAIDQKLLHV